MTLVLAYLFLINATGFLVMHIDKQKALKKLWRIPENTLLSIAVIGGSIGIIAGMYLFRHKTMKEKFAIGVPLILTLQVVFAVIMIILILN